MQQHVAKGDGMKSEEAGREAPSSFDAKTGSSWRAREASWLLLILEASYRCFLPPPSSELSSHPIIIFSSPDFSALSRHPSRDVQRVHTRAASPKVVDVS